MRRLSVSSTTDGTEQYIFASAARMNEAEQRAPLSFAYYSVAIAIAVTGTRCLSHREPTPRPAAP